MVDLCKYKNALGIPGKGIHSIKIFNIAIIDVILTIIAALFFSFFFKQSFWLILAALFILGITFHRLFCVRTTIDKFLFPEARVVRFTH